MTDLIFSPAAQDDIEGIYDYTAQHRGIAQAEHYVGALRDTCHGLAVGKQQGRDIGRSRAGDLSITAASHRAL